MTAADEADPSLTRLVSSTLPAGTQWHAYDRRLRSPMNLVLDEVARQLQREFVLIWVDGGSPDVFVLTSPRRVVTVWSTRYLELSAVFRTLLVDDAWSTVRVELAQRLVLKIVAELCLRNGDSEVAAKCLLGAVVGQELVIGDSNMLAVLDDQDPARMDEAYMALWFTGLAHEFGHGLPADAHRAGSLSDEELLGSLREGLESMSAAPRFPFPLGEVLSAAARDPAHPLHPGHVRGEVVADVFGVSVVLQATLDIMSRIGARQPDPLRLIAELLLSTTIVSCVERCRRLAETASARGHDHAALLRQLVQPAAFHVRSAFVQESLATSMASFSGEPDHPGLERWRSVVTEVVEAFLPATRAIDTGLAGAMRFAYDPTVSSAGLLEQLRAQRDNDRAFGLARMEAWSFCALAASRRGQSRTLDAVVEILGPHSAAPGT
jgi:hypothetical protein